MIEELQKVFEILNLSYDENKDRQYQEYMEGILEWNEHVNLTAIKDRNVYREALYRFIAVRRISGISPCGDDH